MTLEWIKSNPVDADAKSFTVHYLVDENTKRCYACIVDPRDGYILYQTDIKVAGFDRCYITLEAAQDYCEAVAWEFDKNEADKLAEHLKEPAEEKAKDRTLIS